MKTNVKRIRIFDKYCVDCKKQISKYSTRCIECCKIMQKLQRTNNVNENTPIRDLFSYNKNCNKYTKIRNHAKLLYRKNYPKCSNCNFYEHIEICHIKAISDFDDNTPLGIVNAKENIIGLCPNCHWELDNGLLKI